MNKKNKHSDIQDRAASRHGAALSSRRRWFLFGIVLVLLFAVGGIGADYWYGLPDDAQATYVGRMSCAECHQQETELWRGSHHDLAMDLATPQTVLASFDNVTLEHHGTQSRMFRRGEKFFVNTDGPDGRSADFEVKYVFGVDPLQQYMVEFDRPADMPAGEISRVQVLRETWDSRNKRWYYQNPPDVKERLEPKDELHWTGITQRWNTSCADCHSTNLQKNFDVENRSFHTTFSEIDVSCEACHGPGSLHVQLAGAKSLFWDRKRGYALARIKGESNIPQVQACAPCHSRRSAIHGDYAAGDSFHDFFASEVLREGIYHADGQILDEVYEYGSFTQSKMFHKGIRCSDCHDPHSTKLKHQGNQLCTSCHTHPAGKYDAPAHHNHKVGSEGAKCVACHMPSKTYMDVDPRRDHSLRIPRPDLSLKLGTPNACTGCHLQDSKLPSELRPQSPTPNRPAEYADWLEAAQHGDIAVKNELARLDQWSDDAIAKWFGAQRKKEPHFAEALAAARTQAPDAPERLMELLENRGTPAIVRATAAFELGAYLDPDKDYTPARAPLELLGKVTGDRDAPVRASAALALQGSPQADLVKLLAPLLSDESRLVRFRALSGLVRVPEDDLRVSDLRTLKAVLKENQAASAINSDRAGEHVMQAQLYEGRGDMAAAQFEYELAIALEPMSLGSRGNLAALLDQLAQITNEQARAAAQQGDEQRAREMAESMGLILGEADRLRHEEFYLLERVARLVPENADLQRRVGLARHVAGWKKESESAILRASLLEPRTPIYAETLAIYYRDTGRPQEAREIVERLLQLRPQHPVYLQMREELKK